MFLESQFVCTKIELRKMVNSENVPRLGTSTARILFKSIMILCIPQDSITPFTRALVLAIGVCYHAKLEERREEYRIVVARSFKAPCLLPGGHKQIHREISRYEKSLMQRGLLQAK